VRTEAARVLARIPPSEFRSDEPIKLNAALEELIAGARANEERAAGHLGLGSLYESLGRSDDARREYETAMHLESDSIGARTNLAALFDRQVQEAQQRAQAAAQSRDVATIQRALEPVAGWQAAADRLRREELDLLEHDARLVPDNAAIQERLGLSQYALGWRREAEKSLLMAHLLEPRVPDYAYYLAILYKDTGRPRDAAALVEHALQLRPGNPLFLQLQQELR